MSLQTRFLILAALRWLPTGLIIPVLALLPLDRGLSVAQIGLALAVQGVVVLCLELPTGALCDAWGRRPIMMLAGGVALVANLLFAVAQTMTGFVLAVAVMGVYRTLDSGPLKAWFVDAVHESTAAKDRSAVIARGLSRYATVVGLSIAGGALLAAGIVAWGAHVQVDSLAWPYWLAAALSAVQVLTVRMLMDERMPTPAPGFLAAARVAPALVVDGARLAARSRVLQALLVIELLWGFGMITFETLMPIRLAELIGDRADAAAAMGPITAAAWGISALGAAAVPMLLRRCSLVQAAVTLKLLQSAAVVSMGLAWGPTGLVLGLFATYALHSAAGAIHETLLHDQVDNEHRATVLSLASMVMQPGGSLGSVTLGAMATGTSTGQAIVVGGCVLALGAPLFLVRGRRRARQEV